MRIAVNARCLANSQAGAGYYTLHLFKQLMSDHRQHEFYFISNTKLDLNWGSNVHSITINSSIKGFFSLRRWMNVRLKKQLVKLKLDILVSLDGYGCFKTATPQIVGFTDLNFLNSTSLLSRYFQQKYFEKMLDKTTQLITVSEAVKRQLLSRFAIDEENISIIPKAPSSCFEPADWQQREAVKTRYADGKEFFLFTGGFYLNKNLLNTLKAFSEFKKWQQSEWKLLVTGNISDDADGMKEKLDCFKFRNDVVLVGEVAGEELSKLMSSAYAVVYTSSIENYGMPLLEAMRSGSAVITSANCAVTEMIGDSVLLADADKSNEVAAQMIKLYKDEELRSRLAEEGLKASQKINWKTSAELLWQLIEKTAQQR